MIGALYIYMGEQTVDQPGGADGAEAAEAHI